ncbi:MAG: DUF3108 domain-containing protein [Reichenbachiella sp.]
MKRKYSKVIFILILSFSGALLAQSGDHFPKSSKMKPLESIDKLEFKFKLGWFNLGGGYMSFDKDYMNIDNQTHSYVKMHATTGGMAAIFTPMKDDYISIINNKNLKPYSSEKHVTIKNGFWDQWNSFDYEKNEIGVKAIKTKNGEKSDRGWVVEMQDDSFDLVATFNYYMNHDWSKVAVGDSVKLTSHYKKKVYPVRLIMEGREIIKFKGKQVSTYRLRIFLPQDKTYTHGRAVKAWISDDGRNIPLVIDSKLAYGYAKCELVGINGKDPNF